MPNKDEDNALAIIDQKIEEARREMASTGGPQGELDAILGGGLLRETHTFGDDPKENWAKIALASAADVIKISDALNTRLDMVDFYVHEVDLRADDDGEVRRAIRSVIYAADGKRYAAVSDGIARGLWRIMRTFGQAHFDPPLSIKVVQVTTRPPNRTYAIVPAS